MLGAQLEALNLTGRGLWQFIDEFDEMRPLEGGKPMLDKGL
jgi:hypothetical protein